MSTHHWSFLTLQRSVKCLVWALASLLLVTFAGSAMAQEPRVDSPPITLPGDSGTPISDAPIVKEPKLQVDDERVAVEPDVDDVAATVALNDMLDRDPAINGKRVSVSVAGDVATIRGSVDTLYAKERITDIAQGLRGIVRVDNFVGVQAPTRSDEAVLRDIQAAIAKDPILGDLRSSITVDGGVVTINGEVANWQTQQLLVQLVKNTPGVTEVTSRMSFNTTQRDDDAILADVQNRLNADRWVDSNLVKVKVTDGKVALSGSVGSASERARTVTDAWVQGVTSVDDSQLSIRSDLRAEMRRQTGTDVPSDETIRGAVSNAFLYTPSLVITDPEIRVNDGVVSIKGEVLSENARTMAEDLAMGVVGVQRVDNNLTVRREPGESSPASPPATSVASANTETQAPVNSSSNPRPENEQAHPVATAVQNAIDADDQLEARQISASVGNDGLYLYGIVGTDQERQRAESVASSVPGVEKVVNKIKVSKDWEISKDGVRRSDDQIEKEIKSALTWSPYVEPGNITVAVSDGVVTLGGTVENWRESVVATRAARAAGASEIVNNIHVLQTAAQEIRQLRQTEAAARAQQDIIVNQNAVPSNQPSTQVAPSGGAVPVPVPGTNSGTRIVGDDDVGGVVVAGPGGIAADSSRNDASKGINETRTSEQGRAVPGAGQPQMNPNTAPPAPRAADPIPPEAAPLTGTPGGGTAGSGVSAGENGNRGGAQPRTGAGTSTGSGSSGSSGNK